MGDVELGKCEVCGKEGPLDRTYFRYDVPCQCHAPRHFEVVRHCETCVPKEPEYTKIVVATEDLKNTVAIAMKILKKALKEDKTEGSYYYSWQSNIACEIMDNSEIGHDKANEIAIKFLERLICD